MEPEEYCDLLLASAPSRTVETISAVSSLGRIAATDVVADTALPAFATSAMDGFGLDDSALRRALDGAEVSVSGDIPAGSPPLEIATGTAVRVMTGAQVPGTAEVVVPVEFTNAARVGAAPDHVLVSALPEGLRSGWNIKSVGEDTAIGDTVIHAGQKITSAGVGTLAMLGRRVVDVIGPLTIGLVVTGDELRTDLAAEETVASVAHPLIHNSNLPMLSAAIVNAGAVAVERSCGDDPDAFRRTLEDLEGQVDLIITTGGISAGAFEVVRQELEPEHSTFERLALRPGGPQGHGRYEDIPLLHFPGTPTGAFLAFHLFGRSLIEQRRLQSRWKKAMFAGPDIAGHHRAVTLVPGYFNSEGEVEAPPRSRLRDYSGADVVIRIPLGPEGIRTGDVIAVLDC